MSDKSQLPSKTWFFPEPLFEGFILANEASQVTIPCSDLEGRESKSSLLEIVLLHHEDALGWLGVQPNYEASILLCSHILAAFRGVDVFRSTDHLKVIRDVKAELKLRNAAKSESSLNDLASKMPCDNQRTILRGKETGQWLLVLPSTFNGMELLAQEFRDALLLRYARCPPDLLIQCDGCQQNFSVRHGLECKCSGLVISRHNEI
jgi:hypothetical protein